MDISTSQDERMVAVVFDVVGAPNQQAAAEIVREALRMHAGSHFGAARDEVNATQPEGRFLEAWWFPEAADKVVDGNDRPAATLVFNE